MPQMDEKKTTKKVLSFWPKWRENVTMMKTEHGCILGPHLTCLEKKDKEISTKIKKTDTLMHPASFIA